MLLYLHVDSGAGVWQAWWEKSIWTTCLNFTTHFDSTWNNARTGLDLDMDNFHVDNFLKVNLEKLQLF